ncbi:GatB/YqeY domain-containing protein [bacterium]|nr:GatB/YqeY domain-containing protein [bacterium]
MAESVLANQLNEELKKSMKSGDKERLDAIRMLKSSLQKLIIDKGADFKAEDEMSFLLAESKRRKEAIELYQKGGREDLAKKEIYELSIITDYLPKQLDDAELSKIVDESIKETGASSPKDMGKVMGIVMNKVKGQADGKKVQELVKKKLNG